MMNKSHLRFTLLCSLALMLCLCACAKTPITPTLSSDPTPTLTPTAEPTPPPILQVCIAQDPGDMDPYAPAPRNARISLQEALFDQAYTQLSDGSLSTGVFTQLPDFQNGGARNESVSVSRGMPIIDAFGNPAIFKPGISLISADGQLIVVGENEQSVQMNRTILTYHLKNELFWSDGNPLVAQNLVDSWQRARKLRPVTRLWALDRTASLRAIDTKQLEWSSLPGFQRQDFNAFYFAPIPSHLLANADYESLSAVESFTINSTSWGPYRLLEYQPDRSILLEANPYYHGTPPTWKQILFSIIPERDAALRGLQSGSCNVLDSSYQLENLSREELSEITAYADLGFTLTALQEQLVFGIQSSATSNATQQSGKAILADPGTRHALATCLDLPSLSAAVLSEKLPANLFSEPAHVDASPGATMLESAGWILPPGSQTRIAQGIDGIADGTPLSVSLLSNSSVLHQSASAQIVTRLLACGVEVKPQILPIEQLYAPGPDGPLFGRHFDLALLSWQATDAPLCSLYRSNAIPCEENAWIGTNLAGLSDLAYDAACARGLPALPNPANALPALELLPHIRLWANSTGIAWPLNSSPRP